MNECVSKCVFHIHVGGRAEAAAQKSWRVGVVGEACKQMEKPKSPPPPLSSTHPPTSWAPATYGHTGAVLWTQCGQAGHSPAPLGLIFQWETDNTEIKNKWFPSHMKANDVERVNYQEKGSGQASRRRWYLCWNSNKGREGALWCWEKVSQVERTECAQSLGDRGVGVRADIPEVERRGRDSKGSWVGGWGPVRAGGEGRGLWSPVQERDTKGLSQQSCSGSLRAEVKLGERITPGEGSQTGAQEARRGRAEGGWLCWEAVWAAGKTRFWVTSRGARLGSSEKQSELHSQAPQEGEGGCSEAPYSGHVPQRQGESPSLALGIAAPPRLALEWGRGVILGPKTKARRKK